MNQWEFEHELWVSKLTKRPPSTMIYDVPYNPNFPPTPLVNFDLNFNKGQH